MSPAPACLEVLFQQRLQSLALALRPSTVTGYDGVVRRFTGFLRARFPELREISALRRDPHLLGWFRSLCDQQPPLSAKSRWSLLLLLRRLLDDLAADGHPVTPGLIRAEDFPSLPVYLPRPLSPQDDQRLQDALRGAGGWRARTLLLLRLTGMRIGEGLDLGVDCLRQTGPEVWAVHVPLGKLHTERMVPADAEIRETVARILSWRAQDRSAAAAAQAFLLPRGGARATLYNHLRVTLARIAEGAGCSAPVTPHQLRHTFATEMVRLGVSLPALMQMLGHKDIRMTLRYVQITQLDLQREFHEARRKAVEPHRVPVLSTPSASLSAGLPGICRALTAARHLLEMHRRQLNDEKTRRALQRLDKRLLAVAIEVRRLEK